MESAHADAATTTRAAARSLHSHADSSHAYSEAQEQPRTKKRKTAAQERKDVTRRHESPSAPLGDSDFPPSHSSSMMSASSPSCRYWLRSRSTAAPAADSSASMPPQPNAPLHTGKKQQAAPAGEVEPAETDEARQGESNSSSSVTVAGRSYSLSRILSFLGQRELAAAMRVAKDWLSAAGGNAAWPPMDVDRLVAEGSSPQSPGWGTRSVHLSGSAVPRLAASAVWTKVRDVSVRLPGRAKCEEEEEDAYASLQQLALLPQLVSLRVVTESYPALEPLSRLCAAVGPRLQVFSAEFLGYRPGLPLPFLSSLCHLRVLHLSLLQDCAPLMRLHQLERLQLDGCKELFFPSALLVVRFLSVRHSLRAAALSPSAARGFPCITMESTACRMGHPLHALSQPLAEVPSTYPDLQDAQLFESMLESDPELGPPALTELHMGAMLLSRADVETMCALPQMRRLSTQMRFNEQHPAPSIEDCSDTIRSGLQRLTHLALDGLPPAPHFVSLCRLCSSLRSLHLDNLWDSSPMFSVQLPLSELAAALPLLEELSLPAGLEIAEGPQEWAPISTLQPLRRLTLGQYPWPDLAVLAPILASLPHFEFLCLRLWAQHGRTMAPDFRLPGSFLAQVRASASWRTLHLALRTPPSDRCSSDQQRQEQNRQALYQWTSAYLTAQLQSAPIDAATAARFRIQCSTRYGWFQDSKDEQRLYRIATQCSGAAVSSSQSAQPLQVWQLEHTWR